MLEECARQNGIIPTGRDHLRRPNQIRRQAQSGDEGIERPVEEGTFLLVEDAAGFGETIGPGAPARPFVLPADGHGQLHLEHRKQEESRAVHVGEHVVAIPLPGGIEPPLEGHEAGVVEGALEGVEKTHLPQMVLGCGKLLQVAKIVQNEAEPVGMAGIAVGRRHRVGHEGHAPPTARLAGQDSARGGDLGAKVHRSISLAPRQQRRHRRFGNAAQAPPGNQGQRGTVGGHPGPLAAFSRSLVEARSPADAHPLYDEGRRPFGFSRPGHSSLPTVKARDQMREKPVNVWSLASIR